MQTNHREDSRRLDFLVAVADKPPKAMKRGIHKTRYVDMCGFGVLYHSALGRHLSLPPPTTTSEKPANVFFFLMVSLIFKCRVMEPVGQQSEPLWIFALDRC